VVPELQRGGAPVLLTGIGLPDDGLHSPNEKVSLQQIWDGIEIFGKFFQGFAQTEATANRQQATGKGQ
jgi:acetylornithine deacetylase/succinyl-diaminopimelate desuccinylase-like protein